MLVPKKARPGAATAAALIAAACVTVPPEGGGTALALAFGSGSGYTGSTGSSGAAPFGTRAPPAASAGPASAAAGASSATALSATWSNGQAVREYQDFLASGNSDLEWAEDGPSVIVAPTPHVDGSRPSPLADALFALGEGDDLVLQPGEPLPAELGGRESYPVYVALPPSELELFLGSLSHFGGEWAGRYDDLVFFSGGEICGCVEPILKPRGYCRDETTQVLLGGMSTPGDPYKPQDLSVNLGLDAQGEAKWAGECASCGKWAGAFASRLDRSAIRCRVGFYREWRRFMWERAMSDAVFHLVGAVREEPTTVAEVALYYGEEVSDMMWQIGSQLRGMLAVTLLYGFEERCFGFAEMRGGETQCRLDPVMYPYVFPKVIAECKDVAQYLHFAQSMGELPGVALPRAPADGAEVPSAMRQGNLRADGVL